MSKEFLDRLARGQLTNTRDYRRMQDALNETRNETKEEKTEDPNSQEWRNWELSPVWSSSDVKEKKVEESIRADSVQRALDRLDKL